MNWDGGKLGDAVLLYGAAVRKAPPRARDLAAKLEGLFGVGNVEGASFREGITDALVELERKGWVKTQGDHFTLTPQGEARCRSVFDLAFPCRLQWNQLKVRLLARALVPGAPVSATLARVRKGFSSMQALAINEEEGLTNSSTPTPNQVRDALAWRALGGDPAKKPTYTGMLALAIGRELGAPPGLPLDLLLRTYAAKSLGVSSTDSVVMKTAALRKWVACETPLEEHKPSLITETLRAARHPDTRRFGEKAFVASVFDTYRSLTAGPALPWADFASQLLQAHLDGRIRLARADLVTAMDPNLVERSEIRHETATFHFIDLSASPGEAES